MICIRCSAESEIDDDETPVYLCATCLEDDWYSQESPRDSDYGETP